MENRSNFNKIAPYYDRICQLVFGLRVKNAQIASLKFIPANSTVLIVGGGTGWILNEINRIHPSGLNITYLEKSSKMIQLSKEKSLSFNMIEFLQKSIDTTDLFYQKYDVILTPFLLDCFSRVNLRMVFKKLDESLKINGLWLYIDFNISPKSKLWQRMTIKLMCIFFRLTCNLEISRLASVSAYFARFKIIKEKMYLNKFIVMRVFQKRNSIV